MHRRILYALVLSFFLAGLACAQTRGIRVAIRDSHGRKVGFYAASHALVIGVSRYKSGWPVLESVPGEIKQVGAALEANGFSVTQVLDPDSRKLKSAFAGFIDRYGYDEDNRLLFFFAGHGYTLDSSRRGYLVPTDAPDPRKDERQVRQAARGTLPVDRRIPRRHGRPGRARAGAGGGTVDGAG